MSKVALVAHWDWVLYNFRMPVAIALRSAGADVFFVCPPGEYRGQLLAAGFRCIDWSVDRRSMNPFTEARSISHLTRIYRAERPTLVHHFTIKPNLYGTLAARRSGVRFVLNTFTGLGFLFSDGARARVVRMVLTPPMRHVLNAPNVWTVFQNADDLDRLLQTGIANRERVRLIEGSGVDLEQFVPADGRPEHGAVRVVMAARLLREKGVYEVVEAARRLIDSGSRVEFVIAGDIDPGNPRSITRKQLEEWTDEGSVNFVGHQSDMPRLLQTADIAVLPTYYPEGLSRFLLEAAASGLPLVATDIPGCRAIVLPGRNGYLIPPRDVDALVGALKELVEDPPRRLRFGSESRALAQSRFSEQNVVKQYLDLYRSIGLL